MRLIKATFFVVLFLSVTFNISAQDSLQKLPPGYFRQVSSKAEQIEQKLDKKSEKVLQRLQKLEAKIKKKLEKRDPAKAKELFSNTEQQYKKLEDKLSNKTSLIKQYIPSLDTLSTSLKFLNQNPQLLSTIKTGQEQLKSATDKVQGLQNEFQKADEIKNFLKDRKQYLNEQLSQLGFVKELKQVNKQVYYYNEQLKEYKLMLKDHKKAERKALELLSQTDLFKNFMKENSQLASFFPMSTGNSGAGGQAGFAGLQTRAQLNNFIQQTSFNSPNQLQRLQQNIQATGSELNELRDKVNQVTGGNNNELDMPGFKPNSQKTKSFSKRFEYGTTFQSQNASGFFPATSDIGLSVGYKLNDKSIIGIAATYKVGWGSGWKNIKLSNEGVGLRSYIDWKIKGSFWISGGYEQNYRTAFADIEQLKHLSAWQQSGLLGLSKIVSLKSNFFKKTKLQLLWDFLSYQQIPRAQPLLFRIGYNF